MTATARTPLWRDVRVLRAAAQAVAVAVIAALFIYLWDNLTANLRDANISTDFDFLDSPARIEIAYSDFRASQPVRDAILIGVKNTLLVSIVGIVLTLIFGTLIGIARLSSNFLVRSAATIYVEILRNIPPLLVIVFMALAVFAGLPQIDEAFNAWGLLVVSNRELAVASPVAGDTLAGYLVLVSIGLLAAAVVWVWRTRVSERTGARHHRLAWAGGVLGTVVVGGYLLLDGPITISRPEVVTRGIDGGIAMSVGYGAVVTGLVLYTSSHVAEIVRGSIQAVPYGQTEAASALGLRDGQRLRYVVLPQAFRIAIPPLINQCLNLLKNSSLAIAVGFTDLVGLTQVLIGQANPAPQMILIMMGFFLVISLIISLLANIANRRLQLVER